jgi:hypothetical protein
LILILAVLTGLIAWPVISHYRLKRAVARYADELTAQGEKLTVPELAPPPPLKSENAADAVFSAARGLGAFNWSNRPPIMSRVVPGRALVGWREPVLPNETVTNVWPGLRAEVGPRLELLAEVHAALQKPALVVPLDYSQAFQAPLVHLATLKELALWLMAAAILELHEGRTSEAVEHLGALVTLVERFQEPLLISALVRLACSRMAVPAVWEALQADDLTEAQLAALQKQWETLDYSGQIEAALAMELALQRELIAQMRDSRQTAVAMVGQPQTSTILHELKELGETAIHDPGTALKELLARYPGYWRWKWWRSYQDELALMRAAQAAIAAVRQAREEGCFGTALARLEEKTGPFPDEPLGSGFWSGWSDIPHLYSSLVYRLRDSEIGRRLVITALALRRYQLRHQGLPEQLEALVPEFCGDVPRDPVDGRPLRYRRLSPGEFLLYSVGDNGVDDGGDATPTDSEKFAGSWWKSRDAVWSLPAREQERWLFHLRMRAERASGAPTAPIPVVTNDLPGPVLEDLLRLARRHPFTVVLTNRTAAPR